MRNSGTNVLIIFVVWFSSFSGVAAPAWAAPEQEFCPTDQDSTYADWKKVLEGRPDTIYPYTACLEMQLLSVKDSTRSKFDPPTATAEAEILNVLLDNTYELTGGVNVFSGNQSFTSPMFKKGSKFVFRVKTDDVFGTTFTKNLKTLVGTRCVLSFDPGEESEGIRDVHSLESPFPSRNYSTLDVLDLSSKLQNSSNYLVQMRSSLQKYIEHRWSEKHINQFCQPDTRNLPFMQTLVPSSALLAGQIGEVQWYCNLSNGSPGEYQAGVARGVHDFWVLEISKPSPIPLTDDNVVESILSQKLNNGYSVYFLKRIRGGAKMPKEFWDLRVRSINKLVRNNNGHIAGFEGTLDNGQKLTANLSENLDVNNILVDGKPNNFWTEINSEASDGIARACAGER